MTEYFKQKSFIVQGSGEKPTFGLVGVEEEYVAPVNEDIVPTVDNTPETIRNHWTPVVKVGKKNNLTGNIYRGSQAAHAAVKYD